MRTLWEVHGWCITVNGALVALLTAAVFLIILLWVALYGLPS